MSCFVALLVTSICSFYVETDLVMGIIRQESNFRNISHGGSVGLMQILPSTARSIKCEAQTKEELLDIRKNIACGCKYLSILKRRHKTSEALVAAYNAGDAYICKKGINCELGKYTNQVHVDLVMKWRKYEFCNLRSNL